MNSWHSSRADRGAHRLANCLQATVISIADVRRAADSLRSVAGATPVLTSRTLDRRTGAELFLKAELFQRSGSFKFRGAYSRISSLSARQRSRGVVAYSSGNHAQAVALAASLLGSKAVILMPRDAPAGKVAATRSYGAEVIEYDRYGEERETLASGLAEERELVLVPPYDDAHVMAGQGTVGLELVEHIGDLDDLVVPVGGGGLIAGCATAAKSLLPRIRVVGVEPASGDDTRRSLERGERAAIPVPRTIADGLQVATPGEMTFEVNRRLVDGIVTVTDEEIVGAMAFLFERMKIVVEPSGAVAVAALLAEKLDVSGRRVGAILSGGNVDLRRFQELLA
ncbi:MAG: pyridoxal-phosphate dependent enzyme [Actinobacteria bacterium]|nr:pyridoxal-phosphate dependent enzyme [Actinomycetota bacterium]